MTNILEAIHNIVSFPENKLKSIYSGRNRANRMGDAIEVNKTQSAGSRLALNSSYPESDIHSDSLMITKECENWTSKDLIYCVGHMTDTALKSLWLVYDNIYAA